jgi:hypothetical protein
VRRTVDAGGEAVASALHDAEDATAERPPRVAFHRGLEAREARALERGAVAHLAILPPAAA